MKRRRFWEASLLLFGSLSIWATLSCSLVPAKSAGDHNSVWLFPEDFGRQLDLNELTLPPAGEPPPEKFWQTVSRLQRLRVLSLGGVQGIRQQWLSNLPQALVSLDISNTYLKEVPRLPPKIETLDVSGTYISIESLSRQTFWKAIRRLTIGCASYDAKVPLPDTIIALTVVCSDQETSDVIVLRGLPKNLEELEVRGPKVEIASMPPRLWSLSLNGTSMRALPEGSQNNLKKLVLRNNRDIGFRDLPHWVEDFFFEDPPEAPVLKDLRYLGKIRFYATGLPTLDEQSKPEVDIRISNISQLAKIGSLNVVGLTLSGSTDASITWPKGLQRLTLWNICSPEILSELPPVKSLEISGCFPGIRGGLLEHLEGLQVLMAPIESEIEKLPRSLTVLVLYSNYLGSQSFSLRPWKDLQVLDISRTDIHQLSDWPPALREVTVELGQITRFGAANRISKLHFVYPAHAKFY